MDDPVGGRIILDVPSSSSLSPSSSPLSSTEGAGRFPPSSDDAVAADEGWLPSVYSDVRGDSRKVVLEDGPRPSNLVCRREVVPLEEGAVSM